jgi:hypothetical protein
MNMYKLRLPLMHTFDFETLQADRTKLPLGMLGPAIITSIVFRPLPRHRPEITPHPVTPLVRSHMFLEQLSVGHVTYIRGPGLLSPFRPKESIHIRSGEELTLTFNHPPEDFRIVGYLELIRLVPAT